MPPASLGVLPESVTLAVSTGGVTRQSARPRRRSFMGVRVVESFSAKALSNLVSMQSCEPRKQAIRDEDDLQSVDRVLTGDRRALELFRPGIVLDHQEWDPIERHAGFCKC